MNQMERKIYKEKQKDLEKILKRMREQGCEMCCECPRLGECDLEDDYRFTQDGIMALEDGTFFDDEPEDEPNYY